MIHSTAIVHPKANIADNVEIGPYVIIEKDVRIESGVKVEAHARVKGPTGIGRSSRICSYALIGEDPQDISYRGEPTELVIGENNVIREFSTVNRGTASGKGITVIGSDNYLMAYCHVAHDCIVGDHVIMANAATLGGHCHIKDHAILGGLVGVHQFVNIGEYSLLGGGTIATQDIPPYVLAAGNRAKIYGLNVVGLKRRGFSPDTIYHLKKAYRLLFRSKTPLKKAIAEIRETFPKIKEIDILLDFVQNSKRGIAN